MRALLLGLLAFAAFTAADDGGTLKTPPPTFGNGSYPLLDCTACNAFADVLERALKPLLRQAADLDAEGLARPVCAKLRANCKLIQMPNHLRSWHCEDAQKLNKKPAAVAYTQAEATLFENPQEKIFAWCEELLANRPKLLDWVVTKAKPADEGVPTRLCIKGLKFCDKQKMKQYIAEDHRRYAAYEDAQRDATGAPTGSGAVGRNPAGYRMDDPSFLRAQEFQREEDDDSDLLA